MPSARERLARAGFRDSGDGRVMLEGNAARLVTRLRLVLQKRLGSTAAGALKEPSVIHARSLRRTGYLDNFPQQLIASGARGRFLTPAACLHVYPSLAGSHLREDPLHLLIEAGCGRFEGGRWRFPFRLARFHMVEAVVVGSPRAVAREQGRLESRLSGLLSRFGITAPPEPSTDSFFAAGGRAPRLIQLLRDSKREYRASIGSRRIAVASVNRHQDYFGARFRITATTGVIAHSACVAVGLERLTAWCLLAWGGDPAGWPPLVRP